MNGRSSAASPYAHPGARAYQVVGGGPVSRVGAERRPPGPSSQSIRPDSAARFGHLPHSAIPVHNRLGNRFDLSDMKRSNEKSKGLRHFSSKVCEKVKEKGRTNYNEVADELVHEYFETQALHINDEKNQYDMKNIRRRVYDALNVLLAMNIIEKNKKDIHWVGLPTSSAQEMKRLEEDKIKRMERIREKSESLQEMIMQLVAYKTLVDKNREIERAQGRPPENTVLYLPFVLVNTQRGSAVEVSVAHDKSEFLFDFDHPFEIHDDVEVLKRLGLARGLETGTVEPIERERIRRCLPPALCDYVDQIIDGNVGTQEMVRQPNYLIPEKSQLSHAYDEEHGRGEALRIIRRVRGGSGKETMGQAERPRPDGMEDVQEMRVEEEIVEYEMEGEGEGGEQQQQMYTRTVQDTVDTQHYDEEEYVDDEIEA